MSRFLFLASLAVLTLGLHSSLQAHPADESGMRVRPKPHQLEVRLTFNILTLARFVKVDADGNGLIGISELDAAQAELAFYLTRHISLEINRQKSSLGADVEFDYLWPDARSTPPMTEPEYSGRNVDVTFVIPVEDRLLEDFWIGFEIFEQTGPLQIIRGVYEQDGQNTEVQFTAQEPEYLYDTGFATDPFVQEAEKKAKAAAAAAAAVARAKAQAQADAKTSSGDRRWWMVRVGVLIVLIVLGRHAALAKRARKMPTRRGRRS